MEEEEGPCFTSHSWRNEMEEQAKEELKLLETQHPTRFNYLKLELKSFILLLQSQQQLHQEQQYCFLDESSDPSNSAITQGSTSNFKKRKGGRIEKEDSEVEEEIERMEGSLKLQSVEEGDEEDELKIKKDRVDLVLQRAQTCLLKIRDVKSALLH